MTTTTATRKRETSAQTYRKMKAAIRTILVANEKPTSKAVAAGIGRVFLAGYETKTLKTLIPVVQGEIDAERNQTRNTFAR